MRKFQKGDEVQILIDITSGPYRSRKTLKTRQKIKGEKNNMTHGFHRGSVN